MSMTEQNRRIDDNRLMQILQKLEDARVEATQVAQELKLSQAELQSWQTVHKTWCLGEFNRLDKVIAPIKQGFDIVDRPARIIGWTVIVTTGGVLVWIGNHFAAWIVKHFQ